MNSIWNWLMSADAGPPLEMSAEQWRERQLSRRRLLQGGGLLSALGAAAGASAASPITPNALRFLVNRLNFGFTLAEFQRAQQLGYQGYLEYQLNPTAIPDETYEARLAQYPMLQWQLPQFYSLWESMSFAGAMVTQQDQYIFGAALSNRQLFERMVELWSDHFNIHLKETELAYMRLVDQREVIRRHALGTFPQMLHASAHSAAMMLYLDNYINTVTTPNENYAREIMELHTLGVDGGYTQQDVVEVARAFTGWSYWRPEISPQYAFEFVFFQQDHDYGSKRILGYDFPAGRGYEEGLDVLDILSNHPSTARFVALKLCRYFHSYDPPASLVQSVADTYRATRGDIKAMIRTLFASIDPDAAPMKLKRPYHMFISAIRGIVTNFGGTGAVRTELGKARHLPFDWGPPDGYPDRLDAWQSILLPRWNFAFLLANNGLIGAFVNPDVFFGSTSSPYPMSLLIDDKLFGGTLTADEHDTIRQYLLPDPQGLRRDALALALASPTFQWY